MERPLAWSARQGIRLYFTQILSDEPPGLCTVNPYSSKMDAIPSAS
jgi:hypothetical protein